MTLDDVQVDSALLDMQGGLQKALAAAKRVDLRHVRDIDKRELIQDVRLEVNHLSSRIAKAV